MLLDELAKARIPEPIKQTVFDYFRIREKNSLEAESIDRDLKHILLIKGWKGFGSGRYSSVFQNPKKNYVLKINKYPDEGYEKFVRLVHRYPNRHFPRISDMKRLVINDDSYYMYLIEKLNPIPTITAEKLANVFAEIIDHPDLSLTTLFNKSNYSWVARSVPKILKDNPDLIKACRIVGKNLETSSNDMHLHNIMYRKDKTVVIIDPYV